MNEQELKNIPGMEKDQVVVIRKYSYGDKCALGDAILDVELVGDKPTTKVKPSSIRLYGVAYGIKSATFFTNENIQWDTIGLTESHIQRRIQILKGPNFSSDTGDYLQEQIAKLNGSLTNELKKKLGLSSKEEAKTS